MLEVTPETLRELAQIRTSMAIKQGRPLALVEVETKLGTVVVDPEPSMDLVDLSQRFSSEEEAKGKTKGKGKAKAPANPYASQFIGAKAMICVLVVDIKNQKINWPDLVDLSSFEARYKVAGKFSDGDFSRISNAGHDAAFGPTDEQEGNSEGPHGSRVAS